MPPALAADMPPNRSAAEEPGAFRTISEVAEELDVPQHVLRFWETRFGQIRPVKRAGGRRYYRPQDVELVAGIRHLLHVQRYTIEGAQRVLKENGVRFVQAVGRGEAVAAEPRDPGGRGRRAARPADAATLAADTLDRAALAGALRGTARLPRALSTACTGRPPEGHLRRRSGETPRRTLRGCGELFGTIRVVARMAVPKSKLSPSQELMARLMRIVRTCPEAASEVLELMFLVSQIEAATDVDREYRDAKRVISRLRNPLWEMGPHRPGEAARRRRDDPPGLPPRRGRDSRHADSPMPGERARVEARLAAALAGEFDAAQIARVTGVVAAALQQ